jgi:hypothetical protein
MSIQAVFAWLIALLVWARAMLGIKVKKTNQNNL